MTYIGRLVWLLLAFATACALAFGLVMLALAVEVGADALWWAIAALSFTTVASLLLSLWWRRLFPNRWPR